MNRDADSTVAAQPPRATLWTGWILTGLFTLFMIFDFGIKLVNSPWVAEAMVQLGYPAGLGFWLGVIELILLALYLFPRTALLGAVLLTGYMGGAIASHLRIGSPLLSHVLFGVYLGLFLWGGLWLRDPQLRALFPLRRAKF